MALQKKDFIKIDFTGRISDTGDVFDSTIKEELEKLHAEHNHKIKAKPFIFCLGEGMFLKGVEDFLIGKPNTGKHKIKLSPDEAFGKRNPSLIQRMPIKVFAQQNVNPVPGAVFNFDGKIGKVLTVSGGRVMVDFNNPLSGKDVEYDVEVLRKVEDLNEQVNSFIEFLFKKELPFKIEDKKLILEVEKPMIEYANLFKDKFKDIFGLELEVKEFKDKKEEKESKQDLEKDKKEKGKQPSKKSQ